MMVAVEEEREPDLEEYARIPIAFEVREVAEVVKSRSNVHRIALEPRTIEQPYVKDYDNDDGGPVRWPSRFDLSHWRFFAARANGSRVGGAAVVFRAPDVEMLRGRTDVALLWDIRVAPALRGHGVGTALMASVEAWTSAHGAEWLEVETQNVNVPACRFYERRGFVIREVNPHAYATLPRETQLLWHKRLTVAETETRTHRSS